MTDIQALIRAQAALKRSEAYERAGDYDNAYREAGLALTFVCDWRESLWANTMLGPNTALANLKKAA